METMRVLFQVLVAALTVIGFYGILHEVFEIVLRPRQIVSAVEVRTMKDAADLDILLCEALRAPHRRRGEGVVLVIHAELMDGRMGTGEQLKEEYRVLADRYGAAVSITIPSLPIEESPTETRL